jgi:hypothetical protein
MTLVLLLHVVRTEPRLNISPIYSFYRRYARRVIAGNLVVMYLHKELVGLAALLPAGFWYDPVPAVGGS